MSDLNVTFPGQINGAGDVRAMLLKVFTGEVLSSFEQATVMHDKHLTISIQHGKSAQFPVVGRTVAGYHVSGAEVNGDKIKTAERIIHIDRPLLASVSIDSFDEKMAHYEVRSKFADELGRALAYQYDKHVLQVGVLAARAAKTINDADQFGGTVIYQDTLGALDFTTSGDDMVQALFYAGQVLDEKFIPTDNRYAYLRPAQYANVVNSQKAINRDWGGEGSFATGNIMRLNNLMIVKTNNLPSTNITTGPAAGDVNDYSGDFTNTVALVMHESAVGTVKLMDLTTESEYTVRSQGTLMVAKYAVGHGILRPEGAVEIRAADEP